MIFWLLCTATLLSAQAEEKPVPEMKQWEQDVRQRIGKDDNLKALAARYPLVLLHSRRLYANGDYKRSAFSFNNESSDENKHWNEVQLLFHNGLENEFDLNMAVGQQNLVVDLARADFEKDPNPGRISIDDSRVMSYGAHAWPNHVYLERIRDRRGNDFFVLFLMVEVDPTSRYIAFLWRRLPGGKVVPHAQRK